MSSAMSSCLTLDTPSSALTVDKPSRVDRLIKLADKSCYTLRRVEELQYHHKVLKLGRVRAFAVGFDAPVSFPMKFVYRFSGDRPSYFPCGYSVPEDGECQVGHRQTGRRKFRFRFSVDFCDKEGPLSMVCFEALENIVGVSAEKFRLWSEEKQVKRVNARFDRGPLCEMTVLSGDGKIKVCELSVLGWSKPSPERLCISAECLDSEMESCSQLSQLQKYLEFPSSSSADSETDHVIDL